MGTFTPQALKTSNLSRFEGFFVSLVLDDLALDDLALDDQVLDDLALDDLALDDLNAQERLGSGLKKTQFLRNSYDMC